VAAIFAATFSAYAEEKMIRIENAATAAPCEILCRSNPFGGMARSFREHANGMGFA
jgi:hypothetical protein